MKAAIFFIFISPISIDFFIFIVIIPRIFKKVKLCKKAGQAAGFLSCYKPLKSIFCFDPVQYFADRAVKNEKKYYV